MQGGEAGAAAEACRPVTPDIHAARGVIPGAARKALELALVDRCGACRRMDRPVRRAVHRKVRRAGVMPDQHGASEQQTSKWLIHGTGPVPGSPTFFRRPFYRFRRRNKVPECEYGAWGGGRDEGRLPAQKLDCFDEANNRVVKLYADVEVPVYYRANAANNAGTEGQLLAPYQIKVVASYNFSTATGPMRAVGASAHARP